MSSQPLEKKANSTPVERGKAVAGEMVVAETSAGEKVVTATNVGETILAEMGVACASWA